MNTDKENHDEYIENFYRKLNFLRNMSCEERSEKAMIALRKKYPNAPETMLDSVRFHAYIDGLSACIDWIVSLAEFLENPEKGFNPGDAYHLIYHLYNLMIIENMLPVSNDKLIELVSEIKNYSDKKDYICVRELIDDLEKYVKGDHFSPMF